MRQVFFHPTCCNEAEYIYAYTARIEDKPVWRFLNKYTGHVIYYCPFCGSKLPDFVKSNRCKNFYIHDPNSGFDCLTCKTPWWAMSECRCNPPEMAWRPIA